MKIFALTCFALVAIASVAALPNGRLRRDVDEISPEYLPPSEDVAEVATEAIDDVAAVTEEPSTKVGANGYEYQTVRRLKYRNRVRRDVSHLSQNYLPPSNEYLPPTEQQEAAPKVAEEYLPPTEVQAQPEQETEAPAALRDADSEVVDQMPVEETAVFADDGYHYKQPEEAAMLKIAENAPEDLPALEAEVVEAVGPEESAVLADDGYHYRAIKRYRY